MQKVDSFRVWMRILSRPCVGSQRPTLPGQAYPPDVKGTYLYDYRTNEYLKNIIFNNNDDGDDNEDDNNGDVDNENMYTYFGDEEIKCVIIMCDHNIIMMMILIKAVRMVIIYI